MQMPRPSLRIQSVYCSLLALAVIAIGSYPAKAVIYCTIGGAPAGCVVQPVAPAAVVAPIVDASPVAFFSRQDLFDRRNSNNARSDWPAPPRQPGQ
jgi:hypothetical protein